jgi:ATP-dependent RNA helicase DDX21
MAGLYLSESSPNFTSLPPFDPPSLQTLLFSATLPAWVNKIARRYQKDPLIVDLVGAKDTGRLADTISLKLMQVEGQQKQSAALDAITQYNMGGKTIVFVNTKSMCDEVGRSVGVAAIVTA